MSVITLKEKMGDGYILNTQADRLKNQLDKYLSSGDTVDIIDMVFERNIGKIFANYQSKGLHIIDSGNYYTKSLDFNNNVQTEEPTTVLIKSDQEIEMGEYKSDIFYININVGCPIKQAAIFFLSNLQYNWCHSLGLVNILQYIASLINNIESYNTYYYIDKDYILPATKSDTDLILANGETHRLFMAIKNNKIIPSEIVDGVDTNIIEKLLDMCRSV